MAEKKPEILEPKTIIADIVEPPLNLDRFKDKINVKKIHEQMDDVKDMFAVKKLGPENVSQIIIEVVKMVTPLTRLTKEQRASLATLVCNRLIEDIIPGKDAPMELILKSMVPDLIERLLNVDWSSLSKYFCCLKA